jgi:hypothetical protein
MLPVHVDVRFLVSQARVLMFGDVGDSAGHGDGVPVDHGDARGILEKRYTTPATV